MRAVACGVSGPSARTTCDSVRASTSSSTRYGRPSSSTTSKTVTALGWSRRAAARASRRVRSRSTSRSSSDRPCGKTTSLTATARPSTESSARQTVPMPPVPRGASSRYRPATSRSSCASTPPAYPVAGWKDSTTCSYSEAASAKSPSSVWKNSE